MKHTVSIIIPVYNEEKIIGKLLQYLFSISSEALIEEIIVVDGGSNDTSVKIITGYEEVRLIRSPKGRAKQMNAGSRIAKGSILYFLHADTFPPKEFDKKIIKEINLGNTGGFRLKFSQPDHYLLRLAPWFTQFSSSLFRGGDHSVFISKQDFEAINGFDERYVIYEDVEFINRVRKHHNFVIINDFVVTSERRFKKNGPWKLYLNFAIIHLKYWLGAPPEELFEYYKSNIKD